MNSLDTACSLNLSIAGAALAPQRRKCKFSEGLSAYSELWAFDGKRKRQG